MGYVDDYCGGYENLAMHGGDLEAAYFSGLPRDDDLDDIDDYEDDYDDDYEDDSEDDYEDAEDYSERRSRPSTIIKAERLSNIEWLRARIAAHREVRALSRGAAPKTACAFFARGCCAQGALCAYSHAPDAQQTRCQYYGTAAGCRYSTACRFEHIDDTTLRWQCDAEYAGRIVGKGGDVIRAIIDDTRARIDSSQDAATGMFVAVITAPQAEQVSDLAISIKCRVHKDCFHLTTKWGSINHRL